MLEEREVKGFERCETKPKTKSSLIYVSISRDLSSHKRPVVSRREGLKMQCTFYHGRHAVLVFHRKKCSAIGPSVLCLRL